MPKTLEEMIASMSPESQKRIEEQTQRMVDEKPQIFNQKPHYKIVGLNNYCID